MKILFISKKQKIASWSDSILKLKENLDSLHGVEVKGFEIDTGSISRYLENGRRLRPILDRYDFDLVFVNHVICAWPILAVIGGFKGVKVLALHETEPVLGYGFLLKNIFNVPIKQWIRYPHFWNSHPLAKFDRVFILNDQQRLYGKYSKKYKQVNYLGVDEKRFFPIEKTGKRRRAFFPFGLDRFEKGYEIAEKAVREYPDLELVRGGNIPNSEMPGVYQNADMLILPTLYETYSLSLLEAMASNIFVVVNRSVGLIENLGKDYTEAELIDFGIAVCDRSVDSFTEGINRILTKIEAGKIPRTRELLQKEKLSGIETAKRVKEVFANLIHEGA